MFAARFVCTETKPPMRGFVCNYGIDIFNNDPREAALYLTNIVGGEPTMFAEALSLVGLAVGYEGKRRGEIFGIVEPEQWGDNAEVLSWIFEDGIFKPSERGISCANGFGIVHAEDLARRRAGNLEAYLQRQRARPIRIPDLRWSGEDLGSIPV